MAKTRLGVLAACCALALGLGCGDSAKPESEGTGPKEVMGSPVTGAKPADGGGTGMPDRPDPSDSGRGTVQNGDAGSQPIEPGCVDDPSTLGNDCPGLVTCTDAVDDCSLSTQNCCVKAYDPDQVSCNEGNACDGLVSAGCDGPEDCGGGQVCCISVSVGAGGAKIDQRCVSNATQCKGGLITNSILCHSDDDCASPKACQPIGRLPFWGSCK